MLHLETTKPTWRAVFPVTPLAVNPAIDFDPRHDAIEINVKSLKNVAPFHQATADFALLAKVSSVIVIPVLFITASAQWTGAIAAGSRGELASIV